MLQGQALHGVPSFLWLHYLYMVREQPLDSGMQIQLERVDTR